ncbi:MAG: hypothetical protein LRY54_00085 [Alphaproteobacteria bacterium]|nr:hypothetical protein [Alphaproteobacteria bacterium]
MTDKNHEKDVKTRLTELARRYFKDETIEVDPDFYSSAYGKTLGQILEEYGEKEVLDYWEFKMNGGYE